MTKIAIYPGTFDPITIGHIDIIKRAADIFDHLIIGVAEDTVKSPIFSLKERVTIAKEEIKDSIKTKARIEVMPFKGLLVDFAKNRKASVIIRGLRAMSDFEYEFQLAFMNRKLDSSIETILIPASETSHFISSRFVKELAKLDGKLDGFVSKKVATKLIKHFENA